jgi:hypothetical protein
MLTALSHKSTSMKNTLLLLLLLHLGVSASATTIIHGPFVHSPYILNTGFEETGVPPGWSNTNAVDWDYSTAPIVGSHSLRMTSSGSDAYVNFDPQSTVGVRFVYSIASISGTPYVAELRASSALIGRVRILTTGAIRLYDAAGGTLSTSIAGLVSTGTPYWFWIEYAKGSGADAVFRVYHSTDNTKPGSHSVQHTTGTGTADVSRLLLATNASVEGLFDDVFVAGNPLGSGATP